MPAIIHKKAGPIYVYDVEEIYELIRIDLVDNYEEEGTGYFVFETDEYNNPKIRVMTQNKCPTCGRPRVE